MMKNLILILSLFIIVGCCNEPKQTNDIIEIWKYGPNTYSIAILENKELKEINFDQNSTVKIFLDVPENNNIWCEYKKCSVFQGTYHDVSIHIHSVKDINSKVSQILEKEE